MVFTAVLNLNVINKNRYMTEQMNCVLLIWQQCIFLIIIGRVLKMLCYQTEISFLAPALFTSKVLSYDSKKVIFYGLHKGTRRVKIAI